MGHPAVEITTPDGVRTVRIVDRVVTVGREVAEVDLVVSDPTVSRRHLSLEPGPGPDQVVVTDLGSRHGTRVDGTAVTAPTVVGVGARIEAGRTTITVGSAAGGTPPPTPSSAHPVPAAATGPLPTAWSVVDGKGIEVRYRPGTAGAAAAASVHDLARRARRALSGFGSEPDGVPVVLHLVDPFPDPNDPDRLVTEGTVVEGREAWLVVTPERPPDDPHRALARVFGSTLPAAEEVAHLLDGYGLWLAGQDPPDPEVVAAHPGALDDLDEAARTALVPSFVGYVIGREGEDTFRDLLASPAGRVTERWSELYGRSHTALEEAWREAGAQAGGKGGAGDFLRLSWRYLRPYRLRQAEVFGYLLLSLAFTSVYPFATRSLFDSALPSGEMSEVLRILALLGIAFAVSLAAELRETYQSSWISGSVVQDLRKELFGRVQRLPDSWLSRHGQGDVLSRLVSDVARVQAGLSTAISDGIFQVVSIVVAAAVMLTIDLRLGLLVLVGAPLVALVYRKMAAEAQRRSLAMAEEHSAMIEVASENYQALPVVKAFNLADRENERFDRASRRLFRSQVRLSLFSGLFGVSVNGIVTLIRLLVLGLGAWLIFQGSFTVGGLVAFLGIMGQVLAPVTGLTDLGQTVQEALGPLSRLDEVLTAPLEPDDDDLPDLEPMAQSLTLSGVALSYTAERRALDGVDLTIAAGSRVAFVGPSGSGKSTVLRVLLRLYEPDEGAVLVDGVDVASRSLASLRAQTGVVFQDSFLFDATVRENIALGAPGASEERIMAAARAAEVDSFIDVLPRGYDTLVGDGGRNLSGGQRQRVALARALVGDPTILLLDEATSALDARTERQIGRTLERVAAGRTTIAVTHRLASVVTYDQVVVVEEGRFVEIGTHDELLTRGGTYARLWAEQTGAPVAPAAAFDLDAALARISLFAALDAPARADVAAHMRPLRVAAGDPVTEDPDTLVLVTSGRARSTRSGVAGPVHRTLGPGDVFGLGAVLGEGGDGTLTAVEDVTVRTLLPEDLLVLADRHPQIDAARSGRTESAGPRTGHVLAPTGVTLVRRPPPRMQPGPTSAGAAATRRAGATNGGPGPGATIQITVPPPPERSTAPTAAAPTPDPEDHP